MTTFTFNDGGEVELSPGQAQQISESYSWPYEREVASKLKEERDTYKAQLDQAIDALRYYAEPENWPANSLFIHEDPHGWDIAQAAIAATEDE